MLDHGIHKLSSPQGFSCEQTGVLSISLWFKSKALFLYCIVTPFCPHIIDDLLTMLYSSLLYCIASMLWPGYGGILTRATLLMILVMARGLHLQISINNINCALFVNLHIPFSLQLAFCSIAKPLKDILQFSIFDRSSQFVLLHPVSLGLCTICICWDWNLHIFGLLVPRALGQLCLHYVASGAVWFHVMCVQYIAGIFSRNV